MKNLKHNLTVILILFGAIFLQAQEVRSKMNEILSDYALPAFLGFLVLAVVAGLVRNFDLIEDKNNEGTRVKGFTNVGMLVLYVFIAEIVIGAIIAVLASMDLQI